jgi:hypothetical protein
MSEAFSLDLSLSVMRRNNQRNTGSTSVTVHGSSLGLVVFTALGRMGQTGCEGTEWESETSIRCLAGHGSQQTRRTLTSGMLGGSMSEAFSLDLSLSVMQRPREVLDSETSVRCLVTHGEQGTRRVTITMGTREDFGTMSEGYLFAETVGVMTMENMYAQHSFMCQAQEANTWFRNSRWIVRLSELATKAVDGFLSVSEMQELEAGPRPLVGCFSTNSFTVSGGNMGSHRDSDGDGDREEDTTLIFERSFREELISRLFDREDSAESWMDHVSLLPTLAQESQEQPSGRSAGCFARLFSGMSVRAYLRTQFRDYDKAAQRFLHTNCSFVGTYPVEGKLMRCATFRHLLKNMKLVDFEMPIVDAVPWMHPESDGKFSFTADLVRHADVMESFRGRLAKMIHRLSAPQRDTNDGPLIRLTPVLYVCREVFFALESWTDMEMTTVDGLDGIVYKTIFRGLSLIIIHGKHPSPRGWAGIGRYREYHFFLDVFEGCLRSPDDPVTALAQINAEELIRVQAVHAFFEGKQVPLTR